MKKHIIKIACFCLAATLCLSFAGCKGKGEQVSSEGSGTVSETQSTVSELVPIKSTFPEKYLFIKSGDTVHNIKGNTAFSVKKGSARQYDPKSGEGITHKGTFTLKDDIGVGSKCSEFLNNYGINLGYYSSFDKNGNPVDPFVGGDDDFTVLSILSYDEDTEQITYASGGKIAEHIEGIVGAGGDYLKGTSLGKDLLVITINAKSNGKVESFSIEHFIF